MIHRALADLVLLVHLAFIAFVLAGGLLAMRWRLVPILHLPAALWGVFIELSGGTCPLTPIENALRRSAGASGYSEGFVEHYLVPVIYPAALSHPHQLLLAGLVVLANAVVYRMVWRRRRSARRRVLPAKRGRV